MFWIGPGGFFRGDTSSQFEHGAFEAKNTGLTHSNLIFDYLMIIYIISILFVVQVISKEGWILVSDT